MSFITVLEEVDETIVRDEEDALIMQQDETLLIGLIGIQGMAASDHPSWTDYATRWSAPPEVVSPGVLHYVSAGGDVWRHVPDPYVASADAFYSRYADGVLSGLLATRG